jgi:hypothetical protein
MPMITGDGLILSLVSRNAPAYLRPIRDTPPPEVVSSGTLRFLPIVCSPSPQRDGLLAPPASAIEVILSDGLRIAITPEFDLQTLRGVFDALR